MIGIIEKVKVSGGIIQIQLKNEDGSVSVVPADNGPAVRAFHAAYGDVIGPGHTVDTDVLVGKRIDYFVDDIGLMTGFEPA